MRPEATAPPGRVPWNTGVVVTVYCPGEPLIMKRIVLAALGLVPLVGLDSCTPPASRYCSGTAVIMFWGYPGRTGWNLDPATRVPYRSQGCRVGPFDPLLVHLPN